MAISSYADLQDAIDRWLHRSDMGTVIPDLISLGESRIYRLLRVRQMEQAIATVMVNSVMAVPSDYVALKLAYLSDTVPKVWLERKPAEWIYRNDPYRESRKSIPKYIGREAQNFIFSPFPTRDYTVSGVYYKRLPSISTSLNDIFTVHPGLWLFGALAESAPYIQHDARLPMWESKFNELLIEVTNEEYGESNSGSRLAMTSEGMNVNS